MLTGPIIPAIQTQLTIDYSTSTTSHQSNDDAGDVNSNPASPYRDDDASITGMIKYRDYFKTLEAVYFYCRSRRYKSTKIKIKRNKMLASYCSVYCFKKGDIVLLLPLQNF